MTAALAPSTRRPDLQGAARVRRRRERQRIEEGRGRRRERDDIGPAIAEGEPFTDDFDWCEAEWARLLAGARFEDRLDKPRRLAPT